MPKLIIANWKSHKTLAEAQQWVGEFISQPVSENTKVVIAPPFPFLPVLQWQLKDTANVSLGAQTISPFPAGSYTGAVSAFNLTDLGVTHAIVGHSEQRKYFGFVSHVVGLQVEQCVQNGIVPVVCVDSSYLAEQANAIPSDLLKKCVVAYEPVEAIGSGSNAPTEQVRNMVSRIKTIFGDVSVLYGGSVNAHDVAEYLPLVDGFIVGTASLNVADFTALLKTMAA